MSKPIVTWFTNPHEHSLHYLKFGLMRLQAGGDITFRELPNHAAGSDLLPASIRDHVHRRTVAIRVADGAHDRLLVLDGEDSLFQTSPLIQWCDHYLSCTYRREFFTGAPFDLGYAWQEEDEITWYRRAYAGLQERFGPHLAKGRPLAPIGPNMEWPSVPGWWGRKLRNLRHRRSLRHAPWIDWSIQRDRFEHRWAHLQGLRHSPIRHDIVLKDSLWGWPRHRVALHRKLRELAGTHDIRTELYHTPASEHAGQPDRHPGNEGFPLVSGGGVTGNYEQMLSESRLGVFATGFHWGCRNIVTLAWLCGLKVLTDPFIFESWFDFAELGVEYTTNGDWSEIAPLLTRFSRDDAARERATIQAAFDRCMGPEVCARHVVATALT